MTMPRHATFTEMTDDVKARIQDLGCFRQVEKCQATRMRDLLRAIGALVKWPAALITVGSGVYDGDEAPAQRNRYPQFGVVIVGEFSADLDAGGDDVWNLVDRVDRSFMPTQSAPGQLVVINDVLYRPLDWKPVDVGENRSAYLLTIEAVDCVVNRSDV